MKENPSESWLDGEISTGKLLQEFKVPRGPGDDLLGSLWQAWHLKVSTLNEKLQAAIDRADRDLKASDKEIDKAAEAAKKLAFVTAQSELRMQLSNPLDNTRAPA